MHVQPSRRELRQIKADLDYYRDGGVDGVDRAYQLLEDVRQQVENLPDNFVLALSLPQTIEVDGTTVDTGNSPLPPLEEAINALGARISGMKHVFPRDSQPYVVGDRMEASLRAILSNVSEEQVFRAVTGQTQDA